MAELIRIEGTKNHEYIYKCSRCGVEVSLRRPIGDKNTYCGKCMSAVQNKKWSRYNEQYYRKKERDEILEVVKEIRQFHLFCMADMCDEPDKDCGRCSLDWIIERIKSRDGNNR